MVSDLAKKTNAYQQMQDPTVVFEDGQEQYGMENRQQQYGVEDGQQQNGMEDGQQQNGVEDGQQQNGNEVTMAQLMRDTYMVEGERGCSRVVCYF